MTLVLNFKQELTGCFGQPVAENPTQVMMEAAYRHHDLDWRYLTIEVAPNDLAAAVAGARAMGFPRLQLHHPAQGGRHRASGRARRVGLIDGSGQLRRPAGRSTDWREHGRQGFCQIAARNWSTRPANGS